MLKNLIKNNNILLGLGLALIMFSCKSEKTPERKATKPKVEVKQVKIPKFDRDSAYLYVQQQVEMGPRVPGSKIHEACKVWMQKKMEGFGAEVIMQDFDTELYTGKKVVGTNVIAQINKNNPRRILLAAHWDSRMIADHDKKDQDKPILGADDGASGVGVLMEIARVIQNNPIDLGIDIIFFDVEDQGKPKSDENYWCIGSQYWAKNIHTPNYKPDYGVLLDMVGSANARFPHEGNSLANAGRIIRKIWPLAKKMGYGNYFVDARGPAITDDHVFVMKYAQIPMVDIINLPANTNQTFGHYWHTHDDNMDVIDKKTLRAVGQVVTALLYKESGNQL